MIVIASDRYLVKAGVGLFCPIVCKTEDVKNKNVINAKKTV